MRQTETRECVAVVEALATALMAAYPPPPGLAGAVLRREIGRLQANATFMLASNTLSDQIVVCFDAVRVAGATYEELDRVRMMLEAQSPISLGAQVIVGGSHLICLAEQAQLVTKLTFESRSDATAMLERVNAVYDAAEEAAAGWADAETYRSAVSMHASVVNWLVAVAQQLPLIINYTLPARLPTLRMAQRFYPASSRAGAKLSTSEYADQIRVENRIVHPLFAPASGRILAVQ